jgi:hypothetical protein
MIKISKLNKCPEFYSPIFPDPTAREDFKASAE